MSSPSKRMGGVCVKRWVLGIYKSRAKAEKLLHAGEGGGREAEVRREDCCGCSEGAAGGKHVVHEQDACNSGGLKAAQHFYVDGESSCHVAAAVSGPRLGSGEATATDELRLEGGSERGGELLPDDIALVEAAAELFQRMQRHRHHHVYA